MSYAAFKMMHWPTGIENCASGFITHSAAELAVHVSALRLDDLESDWPLERRTGPVPNLIVSAGNVLEIYLVRLQEDDARQLRAPAEPPRGGVMEGISGARLELVCHYRLHGNVESIAVLSLGGDDYRRRDAIALAFKDSKISVMEYDDSVHGLRTSSMHCFEGPEWNHLKRGRESFPSGPLVKPDPQGRCAGVLVYGVQMIMLKVPIFGQGIVGDDEAPRSRDSLSTSIESSYTIDLQEMDMRHVKDFTFVHGYIEPVMVILHETELSCAGRALWKRHTCVVSALSINTSLKQHPLIWSASNLPYDAYKLLAVPSPIGGVLVVCANSIHYHSQSASCVLGLNHFFVPAEGSSDVQRTSFSVELDVANAAWLSQDVVMFSTKNGELLLLNVCFDGRVVCRLDLSKSKTSVLTSCCTTIGSKFFFLGSRLGDSLLVQYSSEMMLGNNSNEKDDGMDIEDDGPNAKRLRRSSSDVFQESVAMEELSLHSLVPNTSDSAQKNFSFSVRDSLTNVGPLKDFSYGLRINADPNAIGVSKHSNYELVCCAGHGKNGALCILQQSIRPERITEVELDGCQRIWTVYHKSSRSLLSDSSRCLNEDDEYHAYLIISLESRTMVLETGELLGEVTEGVDYYVQGNTIAAGNLFGRRRVVQVYGRGARILDGSYMTQELTFSTSEASSVSDGPIVVFASIADPYVLLKMSDGTIQLLVGDPSSNTVSVSIPTLGTSSSESISACTLYHDHGPDPWLHKACTDAWLSTGITDIDGTDGSMHDHGDIYCVICYENGTLEIFDVPNFKCVYTVKGFISGKRYLMDSYANMSFKEVHMLEKTSEEARDHVINEQAKSMRVVELAMQRWSGQHSRPFLFGILSDGTLLCYHAFLYDAQENLQKIEDSILCQGSVDPNSIPTSRLRNLRFLRVSLDISTREDSLNAGQWPRITIFKNVGGYQGLFLSGSRPAWFMVCRERLRIHTQMCDGSVVAFTVLHNVNCNHGLIYVTSQGLLKICQLPSSFNYDNYWPVQKVPLRGTPHQVTYHSEKNLYPVIISIPVERTLNQVISSLNEQDPGHLLELDGQSSETAQKYMVEEFEVHVMERENNVGHWEVRASITMQVSEHALTVRMVTLLNNTTLENDTLLAVGTAYVQGEDVAGRGRIRLLSIGRNSENSQDLVLEVYSKEFKGAISALASLQGHLLVASGPKITLYKWTGSDLNGVAFFDAPPIHAVSMNTVKNFILLGDIHKSIYFLNWKEQGAQLSLLAKDFGVVDCFATEFLIDGSTLSLVVSDDQKNIQIFYYAPKMSESWKGQKLLSRAEFHAGAHISKFLRLQMLPTSADRITPAASSEKTNRFALLFSTLDGSIGCIAPLDELTFRRLQTLHRKLVDAVSHACGLNPKAFRQFRTYGKPHRPGPDQIVDCELLQHYEMLSLEEQLEIAHQIGTTRTQILSNLNDLSLGISFL